MQGSSPLTLSAQVGSTRRWMLILVTCICICIIRRCRPTGISTLNVRVCELEC
uniref:Late blight resistance protein n=1 Tax=Solanum tuberosum TaxID=4113 RepID=M1CPC2_SOLTU